MFLNVSSLWEYFDLEGPWQKVMMGHKKSHYTLQADPEKSRDIIFKNPGIPLVPARFEGCAWQSGEDLQEGQKTKERKKKGYFCEPGKKRLILSTTVHSKKNTCFQEIIIRTHLFFLGD